MSRGPHPDAAYVVNGLRKMFPPHLYLLAEQVNTATGGDVEGVQIADVVALPLWPSGRGKAHGIEVKVDPLDADAERRRAQKNARFRQLCSRFSYAVPAPWHKVFRAKGDVPEGCGLLSVGAGGAEVIVPAVEHKAPPMGLDFMLALFRSSARAGDRPADGLPCDEDAPWQAITRPSLSRFTVGLACLHVAARPPQKTLPRAMRCYSCAAGFPADLEVLERVLVELPMDEVRGLLTRCGFGMLLETPACDDTIGEESCAACHVRQKQGGASPPDGCPSCGAGATRPSPGPGVASCPRPAPELALAAGGGR